MFIDSVNILYKVKRMNKNHVIKIRTIWLFIRVSRRATKYSTAQTKRFLHRPRQTCSNNAVSRSVGHILATSTILTFIYRLNTTTGLPIMKERRAALIRLNTTTGLALTKEKRATLIFSEGSYKDCLEIINLKLALASRCCTYD